MRSQFCREREYTVQPGAPDKLATAIKCNPSKRIWIGLDAVSSCLISHPPTLCWFYILLDKWFDALCFSLMSLMTAGCSTAPVTAPRGVICSDCCLINGSNTERRVCLNQSKQYLGGLGKSNPARKKCYTTLQGPCPFQFAEFWLPFCSITGISLMPLHKSRHDDTVIGQEAKEKPPH